MTTPLTHLADLAVPTDLPIARWADEITDAMAAHQVVVVAGETGSGKSTQLPKICLSLDRKPCSNRLMGIVFPRHRQTKNGFESVSLVAGDMSSVNFNLRRHTSDQWVHKSHLVFRVKTPG